MSQKLDEIEKIDYNRIQKGGEEMFDLSSAAIGGLVVLAVIVAYLLTNFLYMSGDIDTIDRLQSYFNDQKAKIKKFFDR